MSFVQLFHLDRNPILTKCSAPPLFLHNSSACMSLCVKIKTYLLGKSIHYTHHPQSLHARSLPATQAAISRSPSTTPLRMVERPCPQKWAVVPFPRLGQFPPARASVRLGGARRKRTQSTKQTESEKKSNSRNESRPLTLLTVSTPAKSGVSG